MSSIARGQRQLMHQLDNLGNLLRKNLGEGPNQGRAQGKGMMSDAEPIKVTLILTTLAIGSLGIFLFRGFLKS